MNQKITLVFLIASFYVHQCFSQESDTVSCWAQQINVAPLPWPGYQNLIINKGADLSDGFVVCGSAYDATFPSKDGNTAGPTGTGGPYIAKYDFAGNLKWMDKGIDNNYAYLAQWSTITSVTTDADDNIYICGEFPEGDYFYFNNGTDSVRISLSDTTLGASWNKGFIAKLNSNGEVLWHNSFYNCLPRLLSNFANKGVVVAGDINHYDYGYVQNGEITASYSLEEWVKPQFILWIDSSGNLIQNAYTTEESVNYTGFQSMGTDALGNTIVTGSFEKNILFYDEPSTDSTAIISPDGSAMGRKFYAAKYDTLGNVVWTVHDRVSLESFMGGTVEGSTPLSLSVTPDGTSYVSTSFYYVTGPSDSVYFFNADGSHQSVRKGKTMIYKIDNDGALQWSSRINCNQLGAISASDSNLFFIGERFSIYDFLPIDVSDTVYSANESSYSLIHSHDPSIFFIKYDTSGYISSSGVIGYAEWLNAYHDFGLIQTGSQSLVAYGHFYGLSDGIDETGYVTFFDDTLHNSGGIIMSYTFGYCDSVGRVWNDPVVYLDDPHVDTVCAGDEIVLYGGFTGDSYPFGQFRVELSDTSGSFIFPTELYFSYIPSDSFVCPIPSGLTSGSYKVRLKFGGITRYSNEHSIYIQEVNTPGASISTTPESITGDGDVLLFSATAENVGPDAMFFWYKNGVYLSGATNDTVSISVSHGDTIMLKIKSSLPCSTPDTVEEFKFVENSTSINTATPSHELKIYPNPSQGNFSIDLASFKGKVTIVLKNIIGSVIYSKSYNPTADRRATISLNDTIPIGTYIVELFEKDTKYVKRISIIR